MRDVTIEGKRKAYDALHAARDAKGVNAFYASLIRRTLSSHVAAGDIAVDVGAFHGYQTLALAAAVGPAGRVFAFEPLEPTFAILQGQLRRRGLEERVQAHQLAAAGQEGEVTLFHVPEAPGRSTQVWEGSPSQRGGTLSATALQVPAARLDTVLAAAPAVRLMHLDLEGAEFPALRGATAVLQRARPLLLFRNSRGVAAELFGYDAAAFCDFFETAGYELYNLLGFRFGLRDWTTGRQPGWYFGVPAEDEVAKGTLHGMIDEVAAEQGLSAIFA